VQIVVTAAACAKLTGDAQEGHDAVSTAPS
jgi:hypothetical protein